MKKGRRGSQQEMGQSWMVPDDLPHNYETGDFSEAVDSTSLQRDKKNTILWLTWHPLNENKWLWELESCDDKDTETLLIKTVSNRCLLLDLYILSS